MHSCLTTFHQGMVQSVTPVLLLTAIRAATPATILGSLQTSAHFLLRLTSCHKLFTFSSITFTTNDTCFYWFCLLSSL